MSPRYEANLCLCLKYNARRLTLLLSSLDQTPWAFRNFTLCFSRHLPRSLSHAVSSYGHRSRTWIPCEFPLASQARLALCLQTTVASRASQVSNRHLPRTHLSQSRVRGLLEQLRHERHHLTKGLLNNDNRTTPNVHLSTRLSKRSVPTGIQGTVTHCRTAKDVYVFLHYSAYHVGFPS